MMHRLLSIFGTVFVSSLLLCLGSVPALAQDSFTIDSVSIDGNRRVDTTAITLQLKRTSGAATSEQISEDVKTLYKTGFFDQVKASLQPSGPQGHYILQYAITEKPVVRKVFIQGNDEVESDDLLNIFKFGSNRFLDKVKIESLMRSAVTFYQNRGYYDASFDYSVVPVA